jgi:hypothetical protein
MPFINNWKRCTKCQVLCYAGDGGGVCCATKYGHVFDDSKKYALAYNDETAPGETNWRRCDGCQALFYAGADRGKCPNGEEHHYHTLKHDYIVAEADSRWKWCRQCQAMCYADKSAPGQCPGSVEKGGDHSFEDAPRNSPARPPAYAILYTGG